MVEVKDLICARHEQVLFSKVAFLLQPGAALQIMGPNGIGKTTLLRVIAGLLSPVTGKIFIDTNHICYVGHQHNLHPALTVTQNLNFLHTMLARGSQSAANNITAALQYFKICQLATSKCSALSAGQQQRVSLAPLHFTTAKLWLLDEPTAHLDTVTISLLISLCVRHLLAGGMLLCATHRLLDVTPAISNTLELHNYV